MIIENRAHDYTKLIKKNNNDNHNNNKYITKE